MMAVALVTTGMGRYKAPIGSPSSIYQYSVSYRPKALPAAQPTVQKSLQTLIQKLITR